MKKITVSLALLLSCTFLTARDTITEKQPASATSRVFKLHILQIDTTSILWGAVVIVAAAIAGYLVYRFFQNTAEKKTDRVLNMTGQPLGSFAVAGGGDIHFDLSKMPRGKYFAVAFYGGTESNAMQFTLQ